MELTILLVQTSGTVAFAFMLRQAGRQTVTVELTILLVQTSWQCGSSIYAKAGRLLLWNSHYWKFDFHGTVALALMLKQASRLLLWNSRYYKFKLHSTAALTFM